MNKTLICTLLVVVGTGAFAEGQAELGTVYVATVATVGSPFGSHLAGNFEVTFTAPVTHALNCDRTYYTTNRANDPDRLIYQMLLSAKERGVPIGLRISDQTSLRAFPGRCSIVAAGLTR